MWARDHARECAAPVKQPTDCLPDITVRELFAALDDELDRMSSQYRAPLVLCYLEGKTQGRSGSATQLVPLHARPAVESRPRPVSDQVGTAGVQHRPTPAAHPAIGFKP